MKRVFYVSSGFKVLAMIVILLLVNCSSDKKPDPTPTPTPTPTPAPSIITVGTTAQLSDLDPADSYDAHTNEILRSFAGTLLEFVPGTSDLQPGLAAEMPTANADGTEYTVTLRSGLEFADGTAVDADALIYSMNRVVHFGNRNAAWLVTAFVDTVEKVDDLSVKYTLLQPTAFFQSLLATPAYSPVNESIFTMTKTLSSPFREIANPTEYWADREDQTEIDVTKMFGTGPYVVSEMEYNDNIGNFGDYIKITLDPNPNYPGTAPLNDGVIIKYFRSSDDLYAALITGEVDVVWRDLTTTMINEIKAGDDYEVFESSGAFIRYICFHNNKEPFDNANLRRAIAASIDRTGVIDDVYSGHGRELYSMVPIGMWSHIDSFKDEFGTRDLAGAITLLEGEGYTTGSKFEMTLWYPDNKYGDMEGDFAAALKTQIEETGLVDVTIDHREWTDFKSGYNNEEFEVWLLGWYPDYVDPDNYLYPFGHSTGYMQLHFDDATMDQYLDDALSEPVHSERVQLYEDAQDLWAEKVPSIPVFQATVHVITQKNVSLTTPGAPVFLDYQTISKQ